MTKARSDPTGQQKGIPAVRGAPGNRSSPLPRPFACQACRTGTSPAFLSARSEGEKIMSVRRLLIALNLAAAPAAVCAEPVAKDQLLKPPASAMHFVVVSSAGKHGDEWRWTLP